MTPDSPPVLEPSKSLASRNRAVRAVCIACVLSLSAVILQGWLLHHFWRGSREPLGLVVGIPLLSFLGGLFLFRLAVLEIQKVQAHHKEAESRLKQTTHLLSTLLANLPDHVAFKDLEGRFTRINHSLAERLFLNEPGEAVGKTEVDFFTPEYAAAVKQDESDVMRSGEPVLHKEQIEASEELGDAWVSTSTFPLYDADTKLTGILAISRDLTARKYTEQALENANAQLTGWVRELEMHGQETVLLSEMSEMLQTCLDEDEAQSVINRYAQQLFSSGWGMLGVMKASRNFVEAVVTWGDSASSEQIFPPDHCWALRRGRVQHGTDSSAGIRCAHLMPDFAGSSLCVPMMAQGEALGVVHLSLPAGTKNFGENQQQLAVTFADRVGLALANLKLRDALRAQSIRDALTGLFNRRYMEESLEREIRRAARNERTVGAIMVDLDHFKHFNDTFGHEAGDMLLREFGNIARSKVRREDIPCRYGGEEFLIILPEAPLEVTLRRAEEIREAVKHLELKSGGRPIGMVTASIGVAMFPEHAQNFETLVKAADTALYEAKHGGRDRVVLAVETYA